MVCRYDASIGLSHCSLWKGTFWDEVVLISEEMKPVAKAIIELYLCLMALVWYLIVNHSFNQQKVLLNKKL